MVDINDFQEMLTYMRPEGSVHQHKFCNRYLRPVFGQPDTDGNYTKIIGDNPRIAFMSHHDTVHDKSGRSKVNLANGFYTVDKSEDSVAYSAAGQPFKVSKYNCLGADCTTGVYIMLKMIEANVPGVYVVHAGEEIGCIGSGKLVKSRPDWFDHVKIAISFDRKGYSSVITHQMGARTCSDKFANSFIDMIGLPYETDDTGSYTDSNEYADDIPECTNISVGYFAQHTSGESQDKVFLEMLVEKLVSSDWGSLVVARDPDTDQRYDQSYVGSKFTTFGPKGWETNYRDWDYDKEETEEIGEDDDVTLSYMVDAIKENPMAVAALLADLGYDAYDLYDEIQDYDASIKVARGFRKK